MIQKPSKPCHLEKGKVIDVASGFVDTFNWLAEFVYNLKAADGVRLDLQSPSNPVLRGTGVSQKVTGTDGTETDPEKSADGLVVQSAADSNIVVTCADNVITVAAYYV